MKAIVIVKLDGKNNIVSVEGESLIEICGALLQFEASTNPTIEVLQLSVVCKNPSLIYWNSYLAHNLVSKGRITENQFVEMCSKKEQAIIHEDELHAWASSYFSKNDCLNTLILRQDVYENFLSTLSKKRIGCYKAGRFKKQLASWCTANAYQFNPADVCTSLNGRIIKEKSGRTYEYFFVRKEANHE